MVLLLDNSFHHSGNIATLYYGFLEPDSSIEGGMNDMST